MPSCAKPLYLHDEIRLSTDLSTVFNKTYTHTYKQVNNNTMSDGNFNRQLLPKTELSSGIRAGKAQMRVKAEKAFDEILDTFLAGESENTKQAMKQKFISLLQ